jgi:hypothetical protein
MTNQPRERWLISHPEMLGVLHAAEAVAVDLDQLTPDQIDQAIKAEDMGYIPADVLEAGHNLADLIADGLRWRAYMATPYTRSTLTRGDAPLLPVDTVRCPACDLAGDAPRWIDPRTALVVPWDVLGDARPYALVCPEHDHAEPVTGECDLCSGPYTLGADDHNPETGNHYECETGVTP